MTENDGVLSLNVPLLTKVRDQIQRETLGRHQQNTWGTITLKALAAMRIKPKPVTKPPQDPSADALPEDVVMPDRREPGTKPKPGGGAARRKGKHGRPR